MSLDFSIDRMRLDDEWVEQPELLRTWLEKAAAASRKVEEAKSELALVRAEVEAVIRAEPEKYVAKATEASISSAVITQPEYRTAEAGLIKARYEKDMVDAAVESLRHRKSALQDLVTLFISGYFAEPRAPKASREMLDEAKERVQRPRGVRDRPAGEDW